MAYFRVTANASSGGGGATITVSYGSIYYNQTMTCSDGVTTYTKTTTSSGTTDFTVENGGTWTITCNGATTQIDVTLSYAVAMTPEGSTVTPTDDIQTWLKCANINKAYTTVSEVLADSTTLLGLISSNNAVDYMVRSTTWASDICADSTAMTDIGANNYCANTLLADSTWLTAICDSTYFESVLNVKVPTMTSNTTPSGEAIGAHGQNEAYYRVFDGDESTAFVCNTSGGWVGYEFTSTVDVKLAKMYSLDVLTSKIQYYDGAEWVDASDVITISGGQSTRTKINVNGNSSTQWRLYHLSTDGYGNTFELQFYGREDV